MKEIKIRNRKSRCRLNESNVYNENVKVLVAFFFFLRMNRFSDWFEEEIRKILESLESEKCPCIGQKCAVFLPRVRPVLQPFDPCNFGSRTFFPPLAVPATLFPYPTLL